MDIKNFYDSYEWFEGAARCLLSMLFFILNREVRLI